MPEQIGFIGLGNPGSAIAANLPACGFRVKVVAEGKWLSGGVME